MKYYNKILTAVIISATMLSCNTNKQSKSIDTVNIDTIGNKYSANAEMFEVYRELNLTIDSHTNAKDSIKILNEKLTKLTKNRDSISRIYVITNEKLGTAEYKLLRIREYNRIAAQGNNLKFLRGWINRVLNH